MVYGVVIVNTRSRQSKFETEITVTSEAGGRCPTLFGGETTFNEHEGRDEQLVPIPNHSGAGVQCFPQNQRAMLFRVDWNDRPMLTHAFNRTEVDVNGAHTLSSLNSIRALPSVVLFNVLCSLVSVERQIIVIQASATHTPDRTAAHKTANTQHISYPLISELRSAPGLAEIATNSTENTTVSPADVRTHLRRCPKTQPLSTEGPRRHQLSQIVSVMTLD